MRIDLVLESAVEKTPRVVQMSGIFDVPIEQKSRVEFHFDAPIEAQPWQVGLIVGPSGAGKSSVARHMFGDAMVESYDWPQGKAIVDGFGKLGVKETTAALNSVGFSSPPNWVRPFSVLSNGERFRANMARVIVDDRPLVVIDEFTSVVDRQVAQVGSHTIQKAVRARPGKQFVAVTCHYDVEDWLQPDWVLEPHVGRFTWRLLRRRPPVELVIVRCSYDAWRWFAPHHYMSAALSRSARCFVGLIGGQPAAFGALLHFPHPKADNLSSLSRLVVMPDYQGLGLGSRAFTEALGRICVANGMRMRTHPAHPALVGAWARSSLWRMDTAPAFTNNPSKTSMNGMVKTHKSGRKIAHFEWVGGGFADEEQTRAARSMWLTKTN